jgi:hypothetical protein
VVACSSDLEKREQDFLYGKSFALRPIIRNFLPRKIPRKFYPPKNVGENLNFPRKKMHEETSMYVTMHNN